VIVTTGLAITRSVFVALQQNPMRISRMARRADREVRRGDTFS
jgi:hypothetical protein